MLKIQGGFVKENTTHEQAKLVLDQNNSDLSAVTPEMIGEQTMLEYEQLLRLC